METETGHTPISHGKQLMDSTSSSRRMNKPIWSDSYDFRPGKFSPTMLGAKAYFSSNLRRNTDLHGVERRWLRKGDALVPVQGIRLVTFDHGNDMVAVGFTAPVSSTVSPGILRSALSPAVPLSEVESAVPLFEDEDSVTTFQKLSWMFLSTELEHHGFDVMSLRPNWNPVVAVAILLGSRLYVSLHKSTKTRVVVGSERGVEHEIDASKSIQLSSDYRCIIMGTPGLWTYLTAEEAVEKLRGVGSNSDTASYLLVQAAVDRMDERHSSVEKNKGISESEVRGNDTPTFDINDISVTVIFLNEIRRYQYIPDIRDDSSDDDTEEYLESLRVIYRGLLEFSRVVNEYLSDGSIDNMMKLKVMEEKMKKKKRMIMMRFEETVEVNEMEVEFEMMEVERRMLKRMEKANYDEKPLINDPMLNSNYEQQPLANVLCPPPPEDISQHYEDKKKTYTQSEDESEAGSETSAGIQAPVEDTRRSDIICCFNKEAKHFEFYFKNSETMARIIGVGVEYAKAIITDHGMKVRAIEIPKEDWESMWKYDEGLPPQIWKNELESEKMLSADGEAWRPLLWYIAEYCKPKLETMMSSLKDTQTDAENSASWAFGSDGCSSEGKDNCDANSESEVRDGAGGASGRFGAQVGGTGGGGNGGSDGAQNGRGGEGAGTGGGGNGGSDGIQNGRGGEGAGTGGGGNGGSDGAQNGRGGEGAGTGGGGNGGSDGTQNGRGGEGAGTGGGGNSGSDGTQNGREGEGAVVASSNGGQTKATVELELLSGGLLYVSKSGEIVPDPTGVPSGKNLLGTICPILTFTFMRDTSYEKPGTKIETIVDTRFEFPGNNNNNYRNKVGRFGWYHTRLDVSFGVEDKKATLDTRNCNPFNYEKIKVSSKIGNMSTLSKGVVNSSAVGFGVGASIVNANAGVVRQRAHNESDADTAERQCEFEEKVTKGRFGITDNSNRDLMKFSYTAFEKLPCLDHLFLFNWENLDKALGHAICTPQGIKFEGTWTPDYKPPNEEFEKYKFEAVRDMQMTTARPKEGGKPSTRTWRFWPLKKNGKKRGEEVKENDPFHMTQKYETSMYLNHELKHLESKPFKFRESQVTDSMAESSNSQRPKMKRHSELNVFLKPGNTYIGESQYPEEADWRGLHALVLSKDQ